MDIKGHRRWGFVSKVEKYEKIPVSGIRWAGSTAAAGDTEQQQQERDEDGGCKDSVVLQTCVRRWVESGVSCGCDARRTALHGEHRR